MKKLKFRKRDAKLRISTFLLHKGNSLHYVNLIERVGVNGLVRELDQEEDNMSEFSSGGLTYNHSSTFEVPLYL